MSSNKGITIHLPGNPRISAQSTEHSSSATDDEEEDSAGTGVNIHSSGGEIPEYSDQEESLVDDDGWTDLSKPVVPSESASRLISAHEQRRPLETRRRPSKREEDQYEHHHHHPHRNTHLARARRQPHHSPPDSEVGYNEDLSLAEYGPGYMPPRSRPNSYYAPPPGGQGHHYGPGYGPQTGGGYGQYAPPPQGPHGQQLMRMPEGYSNAHYPYGQIQSPYYQHNQHPMQPPMAPHARSGFGAPDMAPHAPYMQHGMQPGMPPPGYFPNYPVTQLQQYMQNPQPVIHSFMPVQAATPSPAPAPAAAPVSTTPAPDSNATKASSGSAASEPLNHPGYEELKKLLMEERATREEKERIAKAAEEARVKKAEEDKKKAEEILAAAKKAAEEAKSEAEKKAAEAAEEAAKKAAEEAGKIKSEAEEAMKKQAEEAATNAEKAKKEHEAALAAATANPPEKAKPIRFKDAVGRKFNFPFHLCQTWEGMEELIKQAFLHVDVLGQHVADGHYDLIGPNNEIILPAVWETVIEPDWAITMHMWPLPEPDPDPKAEDNILAALDAAIAAEGKDKKDDKRGKGKAKAKAKSAISSSHTLPAGVEIVGGPQPPPPPAPPGSFAEGPTGGKRKPKAAQGWSLFGRPPPKPKAKGPAPKK